MCDSLLQGKNVPIPWRLAKKRLLKDFFLPVHHAKDYKAWKTFSALDKMLSTQNAEHQKKFGALHIKFDDDVARRAQMTQDDFTVLNDVRNYKWSETAAPGIFQDENINLRHDKNGSIRALLETGNSGNMPSAILTPESSLEELECFMTACQGSYAIGTDGSTVEPGKLIETAPFNIFAMKDFLTSLDKNKYPKLNGICSTWPITGPAKSMTPMHLEDRMFASINAMVVPGVKLWFVLNSDTENVQRFVHCAGSAISQLTSRAYCEAWHLCKMWSFSPKVLHEWGVEFNLVWQTGADVIVTEATGFHQTLNVTGNITLARNLVYSRTPQALDNNFLKCTCRLHKRLKLALVQQEYLQWRQESLQESRPLILRMTTFRIQNVKWPRNPENKNTLLKRNNDRFKTLLICETERKPYICRIGCKKNPTELFVELKNIQNISNETIKAALVKVFHRRGSRPLEVQPIVDNDLVEKLNYKPAIVRGGYVDIGPETGLARTDFQSVRGIYFEDMKEECEIVTKNINTEHTPNNCRLCGCRNEVNHVNGLKHQQSIRILNTVQELFKQWKRMPKAALKCPLCPVYPRGNIRSKRFHMDHKNTALYFKAVRIRNSYFSNPAYYAEGL